jgi:hypothetical protein
MALTRKMLLDADYPPGPCELAPAKPARCKHPKPRCVGFAAWCRECGAVREWDFERNGWMPWRRPRRTK